MICYETSFIVDVLHQNCFVSSTCCETSSKSGPILRDAGGETGNGLHRQPGLENEEGATHQSAGRAEEVRGRTWDEAESPKAGGEEGATQQLHRRTGWTFPASAQEEGKELPSTFPGRSFPATSQ